MKLPTKKSVGVGAKDNPFLHFSEILGFKKIRDTFCTDFVNYFVEILRIK